MKTGSLVKRWVNTVMVVTRDTTEGSRDLHFCFQGGFRTLRDVPDRRGVGRDPRSTRSETVKGPVRVEDGRWCTVETDVGNRVFKKGGPSEGTEEISPVWVGIKSERLMI